MFFLSFSISKILLFIIDKKSNVFTLVYDLIKKSGKEMLFKILAFATMLILAGVISLFIGEINAYNLGILSGILNSIIDIIFSRNN